MQLFYCRKCGAPLRKSDRYCPRCGTKTVDPPEMTEEAAREQIGILLEYINGKQAAQRQSNPNLRRRALVVTDDGPGFSPAALEHGCERLFTDDSARSTRDGEQHYGLGLYTASETVRAHGGDLVLANLPDGGASAALSISLAGMKEGPF